MRRVALIAALAATVLPAPAWGADVVTLSADPATVAYDGLVRFHGTTVPLADVLLVEQRSTGWTVVAQTRAGTDGAFAFERRARRPGSYEARTLGGESGEVATTIRPRLAARLRGSILTGRVLPARAGAVVLRVGGRTRTLRLGSAGRFRSRLSRLRAGRHLVRVSVRPGPGYVRVGRRLTLRIFRPVLRLGSHGPAVLELKRRLAEQRYALPSVDSGYGFATYEAVLAFQKVHGLPRTGIVDRRFWRVLDRSSTPLARVRRGEYLQISKSRQTLYEVRAGKVVRIIHVSTGATGNTPVGTWRVYREVFGWDWVLYNPMYFLRGFAIHGYVSVPTYPASHGCVRTPLWFAPGIFSRWGVGASVYVFA